MAEPKYIQPDASGNCPDGYVPVMGDDGIYKGCMPARTRSVVKVDGEIKGDRDGVRSADYFAHKIIDRFFSDSPNKKQLHWQIMGSFSREQILKEIKDVYDLSLDDKNLYDASDALGDKEKEKELAGLYRKFIDITQNKDPEYYTEDKSNTKNQQRKFLMKVGPSNVLAGMFINNIINDDEYNIGYDIKKSDELITLLKQKTDFDDNKLLLPLDVVETEKAINETKKNSYDSFKVDADNHHTGIKNPLLFVDRDVKSDGIYASKPQVDFIYGPEGTPDRVKYEPEVRRPKRPVSFIGVTGQAPVWTQRGAETEFDIYDVFPTGVSSKGGEGGGSAMDQRTPKGKDVREAKRLAELQTPATTTTAQPQPQAIQNLIQEGAGTQGFPQQALVIPQVEQQSPVMPKPKQSIPQTPVPNETTSRVPLPPLVNVGTLGSEPLPSTPQATPKTIQGGLGTQGFPQQALAIQEEAPSVSGGVSGNRQNEMMAIADNVEPGVYTDPNAIKAQDVAAKTVANQQGVNSTPVTQPNTQAVQQPKQKMSVLGKLKSLFGFNEENQNNISSFQDAGMTPYGTTGTETVDIIDQNQTLPDDVVNNPPPPNPVPSPNPTPNPNTPPPPGATPGINPYVDVNFNQMVTSVDEKGKKSQALQDIITLGGSQFDDDVYARKLRRQAAMPDLKNEDYFPNQPFSESRTAWGDPIFSGAGAQFPMAAYDAQRKARAQAELDEAKSNIMQLKIPEIDTGAYAQRFKTGFIDEVSSLTNDYVKRYGNSKKAIQAMRQDGSLANLQAKFEGIAKSIDQTAGRAKDFLKGAQEKASTMYYSPEGVRAATNFMNGMDAYAKGLITPEQLNQLEQQFNTAQRWDDYKEKALNDFTDDEVVPGLMGDKLSPEEEIEYQKQLNLPGGLKDKRHFLVVKKYSQANKGKIIEGIVKPFFDTNRTAFEQLKQGSETKEETIDRVARGIVAMRGNKIFEDVISESQDKGVNITNVMGGTPSTETGVYYNTAMNNDKILDYISKNLNADNIDDVLSKAASIADATKSYKPDKDYFGFRIPAKWDAVNADVTPSAFSTYVIPDANNPSRLKTLTANDAIGATDAPTNLAPTSAKIKDIVYTYGVPDQSAPGGYRLITKADIKKTGVLPPNAEPVIVRHDELRYNMEDSERQGFTINYSMPKAGDESKTSKSAKDIRTKIAYKIFPATAETLRYYDDLASPGRKNESVPGSVPSGSGGGSSSGSWVK